MVIKHGALVGDFRIIRGHGLSIPLLIVGLSVIEAALCRRGSKPDTLRVYAGPAARVSSKMVSNILDS